MNISDTAPSTETEKPLRLLGAKLILEPLPLK